MTPVSQQRNGPTPNRPDDGLSRLRLIVEVETRLWREVENALDAAGLPRLAHIETLTVVARGLAIRPSEVATALVITTGAASKLTEQLVRDGLLERLADPHDRRSHSLHLTAAGTSVYEQAAEVVDRVIGAVWTTAPGIEPHLEHIRGHLLAE